MEERKIVFSPPDITEDEIQEVAQTLRSGWITTGPKTKLFEQKIAEYCGVDKAVCLNSATACEEIALRILGIGPGDEVITTAYTYTATASVVCHVGARLVLVDVGENSYEMDYKELEKAITGRTKAIVPVDIAGIPCDYEKIYKIVEKKKGCFCPQNEIQEKMGRIAVIADGAHAFGAECNGKKAGTLADFTSFSFHAVKNLTTAEGGALTWKKIEGVADEWIYMQCMLMSLHGQSKDALAKTQLGAWEYDIVAPFYKCNMTDIMASIGLVQLKRYPQLIKKRRRLIELYDTLLKNLPIESVKHYTDKYSSSGHLYLTRISGKSREQVNEVIRQMAEKGVATNVHYKPLPLLSAYRNLGFDIKNYPNAYRMYENEITLPLHTQLSEEDVLYVTQVLEQTIKQV